LSGCVSRQGPDVSHRAARHDFLQDCTGLAGQSCHVSQTASVVTGSSSRAWRKVHLGQQTMAAWWCCQSPPGHIGALASMLHSSTTSQHGTPNTAVLIAAQRASLKVVHIVLQAVHMACAGCNLAAGSWISSTVLPTTRQHCRQDAFDMHCLSVRVMRMLPAVLQCLCVHARQDLRLARAHTICSNVPLAWDLMDCGCQVALDNIAGEAVNTCGHQRISS
jgi:hypothetical protein